MKIAMCQMLSEYGRPEENLSRAKEMLRDAARQGAQLALLPECLDLGWANPEAHEMAQPIPGAHSDRLCAWAAEYGLYVCAGLTERDGGKLYNTAVLIDKRSKLLGKHRKINLLTEIEGSGLYSVGSKLEVFDTELGKLGIDICADNARSSMVLGEALCRMGAEIILSPSSWAVPADSRRAYYGAEWYEPYGKLAKLYGVPVGGVSNVGPVTGGAWAGWKCIGNSIALFGDGESGVTLPYGEDAVCLRIIDVPLRKDSRYGTALATEVEAAR